MNDEVMARLRTAAESTFEMVRIRPDDLKQLLDQLDLMSAPRGDVFEVNPTPPHVMAQTQFMNMPADQARTIAEELDLIRETDNPDLSVTQYAQLWWLRAEHSQKGQELIQKIVKATGHPTSNMNEPAPTK